MEGYERTLNRTRDFLLEDTNALELGCGTGTTALHLAASCGQFLATDISPAMIRIASHKAEKQGEVSRDKLEFKVATAESLIIESGRFDVVLGFNYLHLVPDLNQVLTAIHSHLKPGGRFISKTPCLGDMSKLVLLAIPVMRLFGKAPNTVLTFTKNELVSAIEKPGFTIEVIEHHKTEGKDTRPFIVARKS